VSGEVGLFNSDSACLVSRFTGHVGSLQGSVQNGDFGVGCGVGSYCKSVRSAAQWCPPTLRDYALDSGVMRLDAFRCISLPTTVPGF
jgi:hypothetical protein